MTTGEIAAKIIKERPHIFKERSKDKNFIDLINLLKTIDYKPYLINEMPFFNKRDKIYTFVSDNLAKTLLLAKFSIYIHRIGNKDITLNNLDEYEIYYALHDYSTKHRYYYIKSYQYEQLDFMIKHRKSLNT